MAMLPHDLRTPLHPHESDNFIDDWRWFVVPGDELGQCMLHQSCMHAHKLH